MNLLKEIGNKDLKIVERREASRVVLTNNNNLIPLLFASKYNYCKLP